MARVLSILLSLLTGTQAFAATAATSGGFEPAPCHFTDMPASWAPEHRVECGWLQVPESRGKADGRKLRLWVAIARADAPDLQADPILYIHGGPGYATVDYFFPFFPRSKTWPAFRKSRDIVFFDQRGTGRSEPGFCKELGEAMETLQRESPAPREKLDRTVRALADCRVNMLAEGLDFGAYNSSTTVEDAEDLRRALGVVRWNLYGISYGSLVGLEYLRRHPDSVRAAILDSLFPPNSPHGAEQITATALAYRALQRACDHDAACHARFPDILGDLVAAIARLDASPLTTAEGGRITGSDIRNALWFMLVGTSTAPWVPLAVDAVASGDEAATRKLAAAFGGVGGFGDFSHGMSLAANCYEIAVGRTEPAKRDAMHRYPFLVAGDEIPGEMDELCAAWQPLEAPLSFHAPVGSDVPTLLYGGELDPATPYDDAVLASRHLANATLVRVAGASHAAFAADDCTRGIAHAFLSDPSARPDLSCLGQRPRIEFPREGLAERLASMTE